MYLGIYTVLIFCVIAVTNSERWYSATILDDRKPHANLTRADVFQTYNVQDGERNYVPLILSNNKRDIDKPRQDTGTASESADNNKAIVFDESYVQYNNTVNNINIPKRVSAKRKHVAKRCPVSSRQRNQRSKQAAKSKFLEVFQVVEFDQVACTTSSGLEGTCLHEYDCTASGGWSMGTCVDGYATCCVTQFQCDTWPSAPNGWFVNPGFPSPSTDRLSCALTLDKASEDIKQIRLDFKIFELLPPTNGVCLQDQFVVSGQNVNNIIPILCGINTGQHVYIEVGDIDGPVVISIQTESSGKRLFSIKVLQLTWADELAAPAGCLQYFDEPQGNLESFNYHHKSEIGIARTTSYLNNLNYAICIERAPEVCSATYTNAGSMQIVNYDTGEWDVGPARPSRDGLSIIPPGQAGVEILNCPSDWLFIAATRLCGDRLNDGSVIQDFSLNAPITDTSAGPIVIWFRSDEAYVGYGFKIHYKQNTCRT